MITISGYSEAAKQVGAFSWTDFPIVRAFYLDHETAGSIACRVRLTLESERAGTRWRLTLSAAGVRDLRMSSWGAEQTRLIGLDCVDISAKQWESVRWEVMDYENDMLHFYCAELEIARGCPDSC